MSAVTWPVASPCVGLCRLDAAARVCVGCGRTGEEIGRWRVAGEAEWQAVVAAIPARLAALDTNMQRVVVPASAIADFLCEALARGDTVAVGCHGAVSEFRPAPGEAAEVLRTGEGLEAAVDGGTLARPAPSG